jgi:hypothetical protein
VLAGVFGSIVDFPEVGLESLVVKSPSGPLCP